MLKKRLSDSSIYIAGQLWIWGFPFTVLLFMGIILLSGSNHSLFFRINSWYSVTGEALWANLTILGDVLVVSVLLLPWVRRRPKIVWAGLLASLISVIVTLSLKEILHFIRRPPGVLDQLSFNIIGPAYTHNSFPSGHTTAIFTILGVWILSRKSTALRLVLLAFASLVGISRVVVGIHWPLDILAGAFIGWMSAWLGLMLLRKYGLMANLVGYKIFAGILFVAALVLLFFHNTGYPQAVLLQRGIALICITVGGFEVRQLYYK
ncbi:phosphatase PAP2 family protein [Candidatus Latescibacterota bacterium]